MPSRHGSSLLSVRTEDKPLTPEERLGLISTLFTSIVCDYLGQELGVHRVPVSCGGLAYMWKKVREQLEDLRSRGSWLPAPAVKSINGRRDRKAKHAEFWLVSSRFEVEPELLAVEPIQRYLRISSGRKTRMRLDVAAETGSVGSSDSARKTQAQSSKFRFSAAAGQRMMKQNVPARSSAASTEDFTEAFDEAQIFASPGKRRGVSITETLVKNLLLDEVQSKDPDAILSRKLERQRRQFHLPSATAMMKKAAEEFVPESPIPLHRLTREVIKKIPVDHSNDSDYESPDLSDGGVDSDTVEAITEATLINTPGLDTVLLRKCHTNLPPHREVIPCVAGVNDLPSVQEQKKTRNREARFTLAPRCKKLREDYQRYMLQTIVPVTLGGQPKESSSEVSLSELSEASFIERINSDLPSESVIKSEIFSDFLKQTNNSSAAAAAAVLSRQSRVMRRSTFRCSSAALGLSELEGLPRLRKPTIDQTQKVAGMGPVTSLLFLPQPRDQAKNVLKAVGQLLEKDEPCLLSLMSKIAMSALPNEAWLKQRDEDLVGMAVSQLAFDMLAYRHVPGHCIRFKMLAVLETSKRNPVLHNQLCHLAAQQGNWLDQLLRSCSSVFVSCRLEAAITLIAVVSNNKLMKAIGNMGSPPLIYDIMATLIRAADAFDDSFPAFFVVMAFILHCHQKQVLLRCVLDRGPQVRSLSITRHWPRLIAFMYTFWDHLKVVEFKISEHRLLSILDSAWQNPLSRTAAKEAMKAIRRYTERRPQLAAIWPIADATMPTIS
nr:unnamed protein product [Spirometra erinaceieuropaei]